MRVQTGTRLGPYEIEGSLGAGGMGEVYRARDTRLDRTVAIKILPVELASDPQFRERFDREARSISALSHPHICTLFDVGRDDAIEFLVMEYLEGETLARRLARGRLPLPDALQIGIAIAGALQEAHRHGVIHRDLKPGNVMLTKGGVKLVDFGLAKTERVAVSHSAETALASPEPITSQGAILGTLQYMAPEQVEGREASPSSDIFAFGAVLYEMVTGRRAFEATSQAGLITAILGQEPPPVSAVQTLTPPALEHLIRKCLAKDPDDRWHSARDVGDQLVWIAAQQTASDTPGRAGSFPRRVAIGWIVAAAVAILAIGAVTAALLQRRSSPDAQVIRFEIPAGPTTDAPSFALSPDGRLLVYAATDDQGTPRLWLHRLDEGEARPIAGTERATFPFWSPDSRSIAFFARGRLKRTNLDGGTPLDLAVAPEPRGGTWNDDDVILFTPTPLGSVLKVGANGGAVEPVTRLSGQGPTHRWPQFLPGGRRFIFTIALGGADVNGVYISSLDGGEPRRIVATETAGVFAAPDRLLAVRQGVLVAWRFDPAAGVVEGDATPVAQGVGDAGVSRNAFSISNTGLLAFRTRASQRRQLTWFDRSGRQLGIVAQADESQVSTPELSPTGRDVIVYRQAQGNNDIWIIDLSRGIPRRLTIDSANDNQPLWSADGQRILFGSSRHGAVDVFEKPANGSVDERPILLSRENKLPLSTSADGRLLLYRKSDPKTRMDLWTASLDGSGAASSPAVVVQTPADELEGQFSPDGRWIAYVSDESGQPEVYVRPFPAPGGKWQVSPRGGSQVRWRRDGKEIFYISADGVLTAASFDGARREPAIGTAIPLFAPRLATGANIGGARAQYAVTVDGRFLVNTAVDDPTGLPITVIVNWPALVTK